MSEKQKEEEETNENESTYIRTYVPTKHKEEKTQPKQAWLGCGGGECAIPRGRTNAYSQVAYGVNISIYTLAKS